MPHFFGIDRLQVLPLLGYLAARHAHPSTVLRWGGEGPGGWLPIAYFRRMSRLHLCCSCLLLGLLANGAAAQPAPPYRNLVMEGGGIRGIAYGGALLELEQRGVLAGLRRVDGTSGRGDEFATHLSELVARKTQKPNFPLGSLHELARQQPGHFRDLYTTGTNLTQQRVQVFSYETTPTMLVADAVRISMSIPLYFRAVLLDADNNVITGTPAPG